jgi:hypothetical protein
MPSTPARRHRNGWTAERRVRQAQNIRRWQPWTRSTGPRTTAGKARTRYNGCKHNMRSQAVQRLRMALKQQRIFLARFNIQWQKHHKEKQRQLNALLARRRKKRQMRQ